jgi:hypothetical protein
MNLFNNYCYPDLDAAATAELSYSALLDGSGVLTGKLYTVTGSDTVDMVYHFSPLSGASAYDVVHARKYPTCSQVGYLTNYSGLSLPDVVEISFGVILVWVTAFAFRAMARPTGVKL